MRKILVLMFIVLIFSSCRSTYRMPNDTFKRNGDQGKWYEQQPFKTRAINKTIHRPRWANN